MGTHFFDKGNEQTHFMTDSVWNNRQHLVNFCIKNNLKVINTCFEKPNDNLATYHHPTAKLGTARKEERTKHWTTG